MPDAPLTAATFCTIMRDTYAGTPFDMARNPASGPFGTTDWFDSGLPNVIADDDPAAPATPEAAAKRDLIAAAKEAEAATCDPANPTKPSSRRGAIEFDERPIGVFRMAYSYVGEASPSVRGGGGVRPAVLHWAPHASTTAVYFPVPVAMRDCPPPLAAGSVRAIDRSSAFWAFRIAKQTARGLPWSACLEKIAGKPVIVHVLQQLHAGGIRKVIIILGARGALIRDAIRACPIATLLYVQFIDLGERYSQGFARSLLEASPLLRTSGRPLLPRSDSRICVGGPSLGSNSSSGSDGATSPTCSVGCRNNCCGSWISIC